ncbi:MAG: tyrosine-type recombinase/integrase, partial [Bacteroidales bacterium]|nr:tyrosine-type recombinase/integrase [Bacteroidales bacterium]
MIQFLEDYIEYLRVQRRYSERTVSLYKDAVERFYLHVLRNENGEEALSANFKDQAEGRESREGTLLRVDDIRGFVAWNIENGMSPRSVNLLLSGLGSYCRYLVKRDAIEGNPVAKVYRPKEKRRLPQFYNRDDLKLYLDSPVSDEYASVRNRTIVLLLYSTGMRRAEIAGLGLQNYDSSRKVLKITGKGSKEREIPLNDCLNDKIKLYLQKRNSSFKDCENDSFFLTDKGSSLYLQFVN